MAGILFWNLFGRQKAKLERRSTSLCTSLARLVQQHDLDLLLFAECGMTDERLAASLNGADRGEYRRCPSRNTRLALWSRLPNGSVIERFHEAVHNKVMIWEVRFPMHEPILLAGVHLVDRQTVGSESGRSQAATPIVSAIRETESKRNHNRTIVVGDFNMNPYESGIVGSFEFHGVMTKKLATAMGSLAARKDRMCFYNPMWACFGDQSAGPPGTHYYPNPADPVNHFWHLYDQVLIRPDLLNRFVRVEILSGDGVELFVTKDGRPRRATFSDHLPLLAHFDFGVHDGSRDP